jgi:hypothetical protein
MAHLHGANVATEDQVARAIRDAEACVEPDVGASLPPLTDAARCCRWTSPGSEPRLDWGRFQEAAALYTVWKAVFPDEPLAEAGLFPLRAEHLLPAWGLTLADLPPMGASPDALLPSLDAVLEIKNVCPFTRDRRDASLFRVFSAKPAESVKPLLVPQVQLEMLCAGARVGYLASVSRESLTCYRIERDDAYLGALLLHVSRLWKSQGAKVRLQHSNEYIIIKKRMCTIYRMDGCATDTLHLSLQRKHKVQFLFKMKKKSEITISFDDAPNHDSMIV